MASRGNKEHLPSLVDMNLDDPSLYADLEQQFRVPELQLNNIVVVDNVPRVPVEKEDKLKNVLRKTFRTFSANVKEDGVHLIREADPDNANSTLTKDYAFIEFESAKDAKLAVTKGDGFRLDKTHVFCCNLFTDVEQHANAPEPPKLNDNEPYQEQEHIKNWLLDPMARDQFVIRHGDETGVYYASRTEEPEKVYTREKWTENYIQWSSKGSYLTTFHKQGIAIWGGKSWKRLKRFPHERVKMILWSPDEHYLITVSAEGVKNEEGELQTIFFWDVRSAKALKSFGPGKPFKWSHDDKYVARLGPSCIFVYEMPSMKLVDQKPLPAEDIKDFEWSPTENVIAYWTPESGNNPARVLLVEVPSRTIRRTKNLFSVHDCKLSWHPNGDFLSAKVDRATKTKKSTFVSFEFFRIREKEIPVDVLDMKDALVAFAWEPHGDKFAIVHGEGNTHSVSFYTMDSEKKGAPVRLLKTLERKSINRLYWSPKGQFLVLAGLKAFNGMFEFWNVKDLEQMATAEHYQCTDAEWDPSGRYFATWISAWQTNLENGYNLWDFHGRLVHTASIDRFFSWQWRPRPHTLLSKEQMKEVRRNLKEYSAEFSKIDDLKENKMSRIILERRRALMEEWQNYRRQQKEEYEKQRADRTAIRGFESDTEEDQEVIDELVEEVVEETKIFLD